MPGSDVTNLAMPGSDVTNLAMPAQSAMCPWDKLFNGVLSQ